MLDKQQRNLPRAVCRDFLIILIIKSLKEKKKLSHESAVYTFFFFSASDLAIDAVFSLRYKTHRAWGV